MIAMLRDKLTRGQRRIVGKMVLKLRRSRRQNEKLGVCYSWSLPPVVSCPGLSGVCSLRCYAKRIHVSGDFFDVAYTRAWLKALECNEHIKPFTFTRSWRVKHIRNEIIKRCKGWPEWVLCSTDSEIRGLEEEMPKGAREAYMSDDWVVEVLDAPLVCSEQSSGITCGDCGRCPQYRNNGDSTVVPVRTRAGVLFGRH